MTVGVGERSSSSTDLAPARPPNRPVLPGHRARVSTLVTFALAAVLLGATFGGQWWTTQYVSDSPASTQYQIQYVVIVFTLTGSIQCTSASNLQNFTPCDHVASRQSGPRGALYGAMGDALVALAVLGGLGVVLGLVRLYGPRRLDRIAETTGLAIAVAITLGAGGVLGASTALGPGPQAGVYCSTLSGNLTDCPYFWGSSVALPTLPNTCLPCDDHLIWGAGYAYYAALAALALGGVTSYLLWTDRRPSALARFRDAPPAPAGPAPPAPGGPSSYSVAVAPSPGRSAPPAPPPQPTGGAGNGPTPSRFRVAEQPWTCPSCGTVNSRFAMICLSCNADRPSR